MATARDILQQLLAEGRHNSEEDAWVEFVEWLQEKIALLRDEIEAGGLHGDCIRAFSESPQAIEAADKFADWVRDGRQTTSAADGQPHRRNARAEALK